MFAFNPINRLLFARLGRSDRDGAHVNFQIGIFLSRCSFGKLLRPIDWLKAEAWQLSKANTLYLQRVAEGHLQPRRKPVATQRGVLKPSAGWSTTTVGRIRRVPQCRRQDASKAWGAPYSLPGPTARRVEGQGGAEKEGSRCRRPDASKGRAPHIPSPVSPARRVEGPGRGGVLCEGGESWLVHAVRAVARPPFTLIGTMETLVFLRQRCFIVACAKRIV